MVNRSERPANLLRVLPPVIAGVLFDGLGAKELPPSDPSAWAIEAPDLSRYRLAGLALKVANRLEIQLDAATRETLLVAQRADAALTMRAEAGAQTAFEALSEAAIGYVISKGPATARFHPQPDLRPYRDIDILVAPEKFSHARRVLEIIGFSDREAIIQPREYFVERCREGVNLSRDDGAVDLHHVIPPWVWGQRLTFASLAAASDSIQMGAWTLPAMSRIDSLFVTALHLLSDKLQPGRDLMIWRDLAALLQSVPEAAVVDRARSTGLAGVMSFVLGSLPIEIQPSSLLEGLSHDGMTLGDRIRIRQLLSARASGHQLAYLFRLPRPNAVAFAYGYFVPSRSFLRARYGARHGQLVRWWSDAIRSLQKAKG